MSYDELSRASMLYYPNGFSTKNNYNSGSFLTSITNGATGSAYWTANTSNARGQFTKYTLGNGLETHMNYVENSGRINTIKTGMSPSQINIQNLSYSFDFIGNLKNRSNINANLSDAFTYDNINRLSTVTTTTLTTTVVNTYDYLSTPE